MCLVLLFRPPAMCFKDDDDDPVLLAKGNGRIVPAPPIVYIPGLRHIQDRLSSRANTLGPRGAAHLPENVVPRGRKTRLAFSQFVTCFCHFQQQTAWALACQVSHSQENAARSEITITVSFRKALNHLLHRV